MVFNNSLLLGAGGQGGTATFNSTTIGNSAWFNGTDSRMDSPSFSAQVDPTCFTFATWVQLNSFAVTNNQYIWAAERSGNYAAIGFDANDKLFAYSNPATFTSDMVFRDVGWYHIICSYKGATNTVRMFVNGAEITNTRSNSLASPNPEPVAHAHTQRIGAYYVGATGGDLYETNAYLAQTVFLDGFSFQDQDITVSDFLDTFTFGTNGSQFIPKKDSELATLAGTAGANSYVLDYADSSALGNDISSKNNNFTLTNLSSANQSENTPSLVYPVVNVLRPAISGKTFSEGNLKVSSTSAFGNGNVLTTFPLSTGGKWYWEVIDAAASANQTYGIAKADAEASANGLGNDAKSWAFYNNQYRHSGNVGAVPDSPTNTGTRYMFAVDVDAGKFWMGNDGTWWKPVGGSTAGDPAAGTNPAFTDTDIAEGDTFPAIDLWSSDSATFVFDEDDFAHTIPTGFNYLNSSNLTAPEYQGIDYFDATIYEGNGLGQRVGDFVPVTDVGTITKSFLCDGHTNSGTTDLTIAHTVTTAPTNTQVKTLSFWIKPVSIREQHVYNGSVGASDSTDSSERIYCSHNGEVAYQTRQSGSSVAVAYTAGADINDTAQWYNVVVALNYDSSTSAANTLKIYVNGVEQALDNSSGGSATLPAPGMTTEAYINKASTRQLIGTHPGFTSANSRSNCYLAEMYMVDGQALDASAFGVLDTSTNRWVPKAPATIKSTITGTGDGFGNCGFYLDFLNASDLGDDDSGNSTPRDFTESATIGTENQVADVPSKNYAVYNTVKGAVYTAMSMSEGNLTTKSGNGSVALAQGFPIQDGYWYYEVNFVEDANNMVFGLYNPATTVTASTSNPTLTGIKDTGATVVIQNNGGSNSAAGPTLSNPSAGDVVGIYIRKVNTRYGMWFSLNGTAMDNTPAANATATADIDFSASIELVPAAHYSNAGTKEAQTNFGQLLQFDGGSTSFDSGSDGNWKHAPVTGFKALNQDNLDETASKLTAWAWIKNRDATDSHVLVDRVRGVGVEVHTDGTTTTPETTNMDTVNRFLQRGVQIGRDVTVNTANESYVLWQWLVGDSATTGSSIGAGSISTGVPSLASTALAADAGHFSVVSWTGNETAGATVGHGMGGEPEFIIAIARAESGENKPVYHKFMTSDTDHLKINEGNGQSTAGTTIWDVSAMSSTLIGLGAAVQSNSNNGMIAYCFRSVPGVCKIGTYIGNGDGTGSDTVDGPYVNCGFKPRWIMFKWVSGGSLSGEGWLVKDTTRQVLNPNDDADLIPSGTNAEAAGATHGADILADGFKLRGGGGAVNKSGATYLYVAMAEIGGNGTLPPIYGR